MFGPFRVGMFLSRARGIWRVMLLPVVALFVAWLLLLLVSLSAPVIDNIFLFRLSAHIDSSFFRSAATGSVSFGVWGYCISAINVAVAGFSRSRDAQCSPARLGYTFDSDVADALNADEIQQLISRTSTAALVLHPIACILTFLALLSSLFILRPPSHSKSRLPYTIALLVGFLAAGFSTVVFLLDVIVVAIVRNRVRDVSSGRLTLDFGNAVWMTLGATIALWAAMIGASCGIFACGRSRKSSTY